MFLGMPWPMAVGLAAFGAYAIYLVLRTERLPDPKPARPTCRDEDTKDWPAPPKTDELTRWEGEGGAPDPNDCPDLSDHPA